MQFQPKPHQAVAGNFCQEHDRGALFLDMGMGKTAVMLTHIQSLIYDEFAIRSALIIAPKRVAEDTWSKEAAKWDHLKNLSVAKVLGDRAVREAALAQRADVYVINRENVQWLVEYLGPKFDFDLVCIDELSSFKSSASKRWKALRKVIFRAAYIYGLTGTPASNGYMDLWAELYLIDHGERLGATLGSYRQAYFYPAASKGHIVYRWALKDGAKETIDRRLGDLCLSMSKEDWLQMPPITYNVIPVTLDAQARAVYEQFKRDKVLPLLQGEDGLELTDMDGDYDAAVVGDMAATVSGKLLQMANGAVYDEHGEVFHIHDAKLDALEEIADVSAGQPILVFYSYKHDLSRLKERFPRAVQMQGSDTISAWNRGEIEMLLCQPASAGHGLNLQDGGHIIIWFGLPWSLELYQQANDRLHRMGQQSAVVVHHLVAESTLDERVMQVLQQKDATQRGLLHALKDFIKEEMKDAKS